MSNTQLRIISALFLLIIFLLFMNLGVTFMKVFLIIIGVLLNDEIINNFTSIKRDGIKYYISQAAFLGAVILYSFNAQYEEVEILVHISGLIVNLIFLGVLFFKQKVSERIMSYFERESIFWRLMVIVWIINIISIFHHEQWKILVWGIIIVNFSSDVCAWFIGKNFGKNKLWPSVSPNKTIEGAIGGLVGSVFLSCMYWWNFLEELTPVFIVLLAILAMGAQIGDLIQSRVKRIFNIKDSSNLIPGHGGIYDRFDSLLFVAPIYLIVIKYYMVLK